MLRSGLARNVLGGLRWVGGLAVVAVLLSLVGLSNTVQALVSWALLGYLVVRAAPGIRGDLGRLRTVRVRLPRRRRREGWGF